MWTYRKKLNDYITAVADAGVGELWIYGDIADEKWYDDDVTPNSIRAALADMGDIKTLNLRVNSYGGSVFAGNAIVNVIDSYKKTANIEVNAYIDGIAASMGSGVPMVADKIYMAENAMYMLHKPLSVVVGNSHDFEKGMEMLDKAEDTLIVNYMRHFTGSEDDLRQLMSDETWMGAKDALEYGLCDEIIPAVKVAASAKGLIVNDQIFSKRTAELKAKLLPQQEPDTPTAEFISAQAAKDALEREMTADELLTFAKLGMEADPAVEAEAKAKAQAYDKLVNAAIEDAIKNGVRAKGESFNEAKWRKILSSLDYSEILDQSNEWVKDAKSALNAGRRVSDIEASMDEREAIINADDYAFC